MYGCPTYNAIRQWIPLWKTDLPQNLIKFRNRSPFEYVVRWTAHQRPVHAPLVCEHAQVSHSDAMASRVHLLLLKCIAFTCALQSTGACTMLSRLRRVCAIASSAACRRYATDQSRACRLRWYGLIIVSASNQQPHTRMPALSV